MWGRGAALSRASCAAGGGNTHKEKFTGIREETITWVLRIPSAVLQGHQAAISGRVGGAEAGYLHWRLFAVCWKPGPVLATDPGLRTGLPAFKPDHRPLKAAGNQAEEET